MSKLIQILLTKFGVGKLVLMVWEPLYEFLKEKVEKSQNKIDNMCLNLANTIITAVCGELK